MSTPTQSEALKIIAAERGGVADIHLAFKDFHAGMWAHYQFYKEIMLAESLPLSRLEREFLAMTVSEANTCPYCIGHHTEAFKNTDGEIESNKKAALKEAAIALTLKPHTASAFASRFLAAGFSPAAWQHAVMVISYFNFANRCAHAMGLELESNFEATCK